MDQGIRKFKDIKEETSIFIDLENNGKDNKKIDFII